MLVGSRRVSIWLCDSQTCLRAFSEDVPTQLGLRHALVRCSPDGRVLAILSLQSLVLKHSNSPKVLLAVRYQTAQAFSEPNSTSSFRAELERSWWQAAAGSGWVLACAMLWEAWLFVTARQPLDRAAG